MSFEAFTTPTETRKKPETKIETKFIWNSASLTIFKNFKYSTVVGFLNIFSKAEIKFSKHGKSPFS